MKTQIKILILAILALTVQGYSQQAVPAAGGTVNGTSGSFSFTVGQAASGYFKNSSNSMTVGVQQTYASYITQVQPAQCATVLANLDTAILADTIVGAQKYRFEVSNGNAIRTIESVTNSFTLAQLDGGACFNTVYAIRVAVQYGGIWYDYGTSCTVTTPNSTPTATPQVFCAYATVANLVATGSTIQWYTSANDGAALATTTALTTGTYYASQTVNGCESTRTAVTVTVNETQITASANTVCSGTAVTITASASSAGATTLAANLQNGLVGYWPFNGNANDASGNNNNGTVNGATLTTDRLGNSNEAYSFDGLNDVINLPLNSGQIANSTNFSIQYWILPDSTVTTPQVVFANWESVPNVPSLTPVGFFTGYFNNNLGNNIFTAYENNFGVNDNINFDTSNWNQIIIVYDGNQALANERQKVFLNGILQIDNFNCQFCPNNIPQTIGSIFNHTSIGGRYVGYQNTLIDKFKGKIDDIAIYNRALTASEIQQIYNSTQTTYLWSTGETTATINPSPTETTAYWCDVTVNGVTCRKEMTITVNPNPAPIVAAQTFCSASTVSNLAATGTDVKWYASANDGAALATTTALTTGTYYASQTVNGCESTRTAVNVTVNETQITASATTVCSGTEVTITASATSAGATTLPANLQNGLVGYWPFNGNANDASGNGNNGIVNGATLTTDRFGNSNSAYSFDGTSAYIEVNNIGNTVTNKTFSAWVLLNSLSQSGAGLVSIVMNGGNNFDSIVYNEWNNGWMFGSDTFTRSSTSNYSEINKEWVNITCSYAPNDYRMYRNGVLIHQSTNYNILPFSNSSFLFGERHPGHINAFLNGKIDDIAIYNRALSLSEIQQLNNSSTYLWSTGETTATINPTPTETTTYWCDVTVNGVTCRKEMTITVIPNTAPTAAAQTFCTASTIASLTASGNDIQWYASANDGAALATTTALTTETYYASQTVNGCESTRTAVNITVNETQITASANTVCSGVSIVLQIENTIPTIQDLLYLGEFQGHYYYQSKIKNGWNYFNNYIRNNFSNAYLCVIESAEENQFITANSNNIYSWIGLYQDLTSSDYFEPNGGWRWVNGSLLNSYSNWGIGEPNNGDGQEHFAHINHPNYSPGSWNDGMDIYQLNAIFEFNSQPFLNATYTWSTGETTATINPTPTETTTYWCDVMVNGVTCRKEMTITVVPQVAPTFTQIASTCSGSNLTALPTTSNNGITGTWSPEINNNVTTTYIFNPDAGQCATTTTQTINITTPKVTSPISFVAPTTTVAALPNVTIGTQIWTSKNLDVSTYRDGTPIPQVTDPSQWENLTTGAWCYYNNDEANGAIYGKLYNWYAVAGIHDNDPNTPNKTLAPSGWHVGSDFEYNTLVTFLGGNDIAGGKMKSTGTSLWMSPNLNATNSSYFTGLPGGYRKYDESFDYIGNYGFWWSSSEYDSENARGRFINYSGGFIYNYDNKKAYGMSVRLIKD